MRNHSAWVCAALAMVMVCPDRVGAEDFERIRPEASILKTAFATAFERSPTFRSMVERVGGSDVIVHVTCGYFKSVLLAGQTMLSAAGPDVRYVRVQILCDQSPAALVAIVAHELQHVVEIASAPSVVDDRSFERLFRRIGSFTCGSRYSRQFETHAAVAAGQRVRAEAFGYAESSAQATRRAEVPGHARIGD